MRAASVMAAGLCFLALVAPHPSAAQSPAVKAAVGFMKHRLVVTAKGARIEPAYKFSSKRLPLDVEVDELPISWGAAGASGLTLLFCIFTGECGHKK